MVSLSLKQERGYELACMANIAASNSLLCKYLDNA